MRIRLRNGIEIEGKRRILMDPASTEEDSITLISHAHSDHVPRDVRNPRGFVFSSRATMEILSSFYGADKVNAMEFNSQYDFNGIKVTPLVAGHILGSTMYLIEHDGPRILYTGDINVEGGLTVEGPADLQEADILIIEATYGSPDYIFPDQDRVRMDLVKWAADSVKDGFIPMISAYTIGKSQEIIYLLNKLTNLPVVVSRGVARASRAYLNYFDLRYELDHDEPYVYVSSRWKDAERSVKAVATGWAIKRDFGDAKGFCLSSHSDFNGLLRAVMKVDPEMVITVYGQSKRFAEELRKMGIKAEALSSSFIKL
ncbi:MAG: MBL fold metallo-hydrolase [Candidatus Methanodesulfokora sp.]|jgi:putative mRNA 3-end processing factor